ncbi:MAG: hypothetical protein ACXU9U_05595 [Parachlamydiaceae bacterium]
MAFSQNTAFFNSIDTFENTYEHSYSHGLEKIYALENIDIRSIRKIAPRNLPSKPSKKIAKPSLVPQTEQLEFAFEPQFQKFIPPFVYQEPIQVLDLSKRIEQNLLEQNKILLSDLLAHPLETLAIKGIGQGHLDEISSKLQNYLDEHLNHCEQKIDFSSWLKTLLGTLDRKKCAVLLESFDLPSLLPLSPSDHADLRKLSPEKRSSWIEDAIQEICCSEKKQRVNADLQQIVDVFIKPWLCRRNGIAHRDELQEYLFKLGNFHSSSLPILLFVESLYFQDRFLLAPFLFPVEEELFCDNLETAETFRKCMNTAKTYFYHDDLHYPLHSLTQWIDRELASEWRYTPEGFIERSLRLSSAFSVRKNILEQLIVKLS